MSNIPALHLACRPYAVPCGHPVDSCPAAYSCQTYRAYPAFQAFRSCQPPCHPSASDACHPDRQALGHRVVRHQRPAAEHSAPFHDPVDSLPTSISNSQYVHNAFWSIRLCAKFPCANRHSPPSTLAPDARQTTKNVFVWKTLPFGVPNRWISMWSGRLQGQFQVCQCRSTSPVLSTHEHMPETNEKTTFKQW